MQELPPILSGSAESQLGQLRDYLVRLVGSLAQAEAAAYGGAAVSCGTGRADTAAENTQAGAEDALRALIIKTAGRVQRNVESLSARLSEDYLAVSDFGDYSEQLRAEFTATARQVVESYSFDSRLSTVSDGLGQVSTVLDSLSGQIRRGVISDPDTGETALGIAIAESLSFTGETLTVSGQEYHRLSPGQTLGIYTAGGWQFWINGAKKGWFDASDGLLHVGSLMVEDSFRLGEGWLLSHSDGLGIRKIM